MGLKPVRVSQLNHYINRVLKTDPILGNVSVIGEVSNLKYHNSGNVYFSLKDEASTVRCFLSRYKKEELSCPLDEGMEIVVTGFISVYEIGGYYSLQVKDIEINGSGQLAVQFEMLKQKLEREGLFAASHKKPLPAFPKKIAVVTSPTGAAVSDITRTIKNKNDYVDILIVPVLVQGPGAAEDIAKAIDFLNAARPDVDVIITGRGGGSMEDLWAFNEEVVARSIFASHIPVISGVGHETDFTIADFVADVRAATPTAAAETAAPDIREVREYIKGLKESLSADLQQMVEYKRKLLFALDPEAFANGIKNRIAYEQATTERLMDGMTDQMEGKIKSLREKVMMLGKLNEAANPTAILSRGYSVVYNSHGTIINSTDGLTPGEVVDIQTASGRAEAEITRIKQEQ